MKKSNSYQASADLKIPVAKLIKLTVQTIYTNDPTLKVEAFIE
jgi:hypothetical protein